MYPNDLYYTQNHQWARIEDSTATVGISHYAQEQLGDLVYVELPSVDEEVSAGQPMGSVESVKAVADVNAPVSGRVIAVNEALEETPEQINQDCYGVGWMVKLELSNPVEVKSLLSSTASQAFLQDLQGRK